MVHRVRGTYGFNRFRPSDVLGEDESLGCGDVKEQSSVWCLEGPGHAANCSVRTVLLASEETCEAGDIVMPTLEVRRLGLCEFK